jgi:hypothetical protein
MMERFRAWNENKTIDFNKAAIFTVGIILLLYVFDMDIFKLIGFLMGMTLIIGALSS